MQLKGLRQITPYVAGAQPKEAKMIKLNTNENAYPASPKVQAALQEFSAHHLSRYSTLEQDDLRQALADQLGLEKDNLIIGNGSDDILSLAFLSFFNSADPVLFPDLTYGFYKVWADLYHIPFKEIPLAEDFTIDFAAYDKVNGGIVIANPNAPTGIGKSLEELESFLKAHQDVVVIVDEAYVNFGGQTAIPLLKDYPNLFITRTFSKDASLAGLRVGYGIGHPDLIKVIHAVKHSVNPYAVDSLAETLATAAVNDWAYYEKTCQMIQDTRDRFRQNLIDLGFTVLPSQTNFVLAKPNHCTAEALFKALEAQHIYVRFFPKVERIKDYLRISIGTDEEMQAVYQVIKETTTNE